MIVDWYFNQDSGEPLPYSEPAARAASAVARTAADIDVRPVGFVFARMDAEVDGSGARVADEPETHVLDPAALALPRLLLDEMAAARRIAVGFARRA